MVQYGRSSRSSWAKYVRPSSGRTIMGKAIWENPIEAWLGKDSKLECLFVHRQKGVFLSVYVDDIKLAGKKQNIHPMWESSKQRSWFGRTNIFPWSCILGPALKDNVKWVKILWTITEPCLNREFQREEQKSVLSLKIFVFLHGLMIWRVMQRSVWSDIVS